MVVAPTVVVVGAVVRHRMNEAALLGVVIRRRWMLLLLVLYHHHTIPLHLITSITVTSITVTVTSNSSRIIIEVTRATTVGPLLHRQGVVPWAATTEVLPHEVVIQTEVPREVATQTEVPHVVVMIDRRLDTIITITIITMAIIVHHRQEVVSTAGTRTTHHMMVLRLVPVVPVAPHPHQRNHPGSSTATTIIHVVGVRTTMTTHRPLARTTTMDHLLRPEIETIVMNAIRRASAIMTVVGVVVVAVVATIDLLHRPHVVRSLLFGRCTWCLV